MKVHNDVIMHKRGFVRHILLIVAGLLLLTYVGIDVSNAANIPVVDSIIEFVRGFGRDIAALFSGR